MMSNKEQQSGTTKVLSHTSPDMPLVERVEDAGAPKVLRAAQLDRDARFFLRLNHLIPKSVTASTSIKHMRKSWSLAAQALGSRPDVATVTNIEIQGPNGPIALRLFTPTMTDQLLPAFAWCFGGGFIIGDLETAESVCRNIAIAANCITVGINYRLAPEYEITASRQDVLAAMEWLVAHGKQYGIDTSRLALGGDSAGGNLTAVVSQELRQRGGLELKLQVLVYPATELAAKFPSFDENIHGDYMLNADAFANIEMHLIPAMINADPELPWFSPRRCEDMSGLPPAMVITAGFDPIRDHGIDYAARLRRANVPVELVHYAGLFHGFINLDNLIMGSRDALTRISESLVNAFRLERMANRTIEVSDAENQTNLVGALVGELAESSAAVLEMAAGWRERALDAMPRRFSRYLRLILAPTLGASDLMHQLGEKALCNLACVLTYSDGDDGVSSSSTTS
jgi:acetyl esterase